MGGILITDDGAPFGDEGNRTSNFMVPPPRAASSEVKQARLESNPCGIPRLTPQPLPTSTPEGTTRKDGRCVL